MINDDNIKKIMQNTNTDLSLFNGAQVTSYHDIITPSWGKPVALKQGKKEISRINSTTNYASFARSVGNETCGALLIGGGDVDVWLGTYNDLSHPINNQTMYWDPITISLKSGDCLIFSAGVAGESKMLIQKMKHAFRSNVWMAYFARIPESTEYVFYSTVVLRYHFACDDFFFVYDSYMTQVIRKWNWWTFSQILDQMTNNLICILFILIVIIFNTVNTKYALFFFNKFHLLIKINKLYMSSLSRYRLQTITQSSISIRQHVSSLPISGLRGGARYYNQPVNHSQPTGLVVHQHTGFKNTGTTCFINAVLQAILHNPTLCSWLQHSDIHTKHCINKASCSTCRLTSLLFQSAHSHSRSIFPNFFIHHCKNVLKINTNSHQDAAIYLTSLLVTCYHHHTI